jgi:chaperonin cofactor prefoldin
VEFAKALSKSNSDEAIEGLARIVTEEKDTVVLPFVFRAAGEYRDKRIREALAGRLAGELAPLGRAKAYEAMGAQRADAEWELLLKGSQETGYHGTAQSGAFRGLAATRRQEAPGLLLDQIGYGKLPARVRPAVASGLGDLGQGLEKAERERVRETLEDLLRDPDLKVQHAAGMALLTMRATEAIPALKAYRNNMAEQNKIFVDRLIDGLKIQDKIDGSAVKKQVEGLEKQVRQLAEQLQRLEAQINAKAEKAE